MCPADGFTLDGAAASTTKTEPTLCPIQVFSQARGPFLQWPAKRPRLKPGFGESFFDINGSYRRDANIILHPGLPADDWPNLVRKPPGKELWSCPKKEFSAEHVVTLLRQIEVTLAPGKSALIACGMLAYRRGAIIAGQEIC